MDNPETLATLVHKTQNEDKKTNEKRQHTKLKR